MLNGRMRADHLQRHLDLSVPFAAFAERGEILMRTTMRGACHGLSFAYRYDCALNACPVPLLLPGFRPETGLLLGPIAYVPEWFVVWLRSRIVYFRLNIIDPAACSAALPALFVVAVIMWKSPYFASWFFNNRPFPELNIDRAEREGHRFFSM